MKRVLLTVAVALLIPGLLGATPTLGVYYEGKLHYTPAQYEEFDLCLYMVQNEYYVTGVEYQLVRSGSGFTMSGVSYPDNFAVELGDPLSGHSITFWPPMTGYPEGYDLLATYHCMMTRPCEDIPNYTLTIGPHPDSGELRGTRTPNNDLFDIIGLTTYICPDGVANEDGSWGAIKSLYR